ncbi:hypothetical protein AB0N38_33165 [Micromonospora aurantiaca]|uniref:hypothetical protein n=1 Tax=Micromonospora aurantiaca (nom. illeg.) TaxID=47850 RepID=UPI0034366BF9
MGTGPGGRCEAHKRQRAPDRRPSAGARGYGHQHREEFRAAVIARDPVCRCDRTCRGRHAHPAGQCGQPSKRADHWPMSREALIAHGLNPNDPRFGRGLCPSCDSRQTAIRQPGGWNRRGGGGRAT